MIFEALYASAQKNELILIDGGLCHWHLRRDGQLTISEIISTRPGAGQEMLQILKQNTKAVFILSKCPADLTANNWWEKQGFVKLKKEKTRTGRVLNVWVYKPTQPNRKKGLNIKE